MSLNDFLEGLVEAVAGRAGDGARHMAGGLAAADRRERGLPTTARVAPNTIYSGGPAAEPPVPRRPMGARQAPNALVSRGSLGPAFDVDERATQRLLGHDPRVVPLQGEGPGLGYWNGHELQSMQDARGLLGGGMRSAMSTPTLNLSQLQPAEPEQRLNLPSWLARFG